ncbi:MAG: hypothetical protein WCG25_08185 [bacterium]
MNKSDFEKLKDINVFYGAFRVPNHGINLFIFIWGFAPRRQNTFWHCSKKYSKKSRKIIRHLIFLGLLSQCNVSSNNYVYKCCYEIYKITTSHLAFSLKYFASSKVHTMLS